MERRAGLRLGRVRTTLSYYYGRIAHTQTHSSRTQLTTIRSEPASTRARDPTTFNDSLAKSLADVMSAHCNTCLWLFKWFIFIDCFCLVARQKIMMAEWIRLPLWPVIAKVIAATMLFGRLVMEYVTRKWVVKWVKLRHLSFGVRAVVVCRQV